jgi:hypothetical protein
MTTFHQELKQITDPELLAAYVDLMARDYAVFEAAMVARRITRRRQTQ